MFKKLDNKKRRIIGFSVMGATIAFGLTSTLMVAPGMGIESLRFIKSVERELKDITPKGKFVLDSKSMSYGIVKNVIKQSFVADAISTINHNDKEQLAMRDLYEQYALYWFNDNFGENTDIDLYDIGNSLIEFDKSIASKFNSNGFVNTGIGWMFSHGGMNELYSKDIKELASNQQSIIAQSDYEASIRDNGSLGNIGGLEVEFSMGANIVNNKVWFLNKQIESIRTALTLHFKGGALGLTVFKDENKQLSLEDEIFSKVLTIDDLYHPDFINTLNVLRVGIIFFILNIAIIPTGATISTLALIGTKSKKESLNSGEDKNEKIN